MKVLVQVVGAVVIHVACGMYLLSQLGGSKKASVLACQVHVRLLMWASFIHDKIYNKSNSLSNSE